LEEGWLQRGGVWVLLPQPKSACTRACLDARTAPLNTLCWHEPALHLRR